MTPAFGIKETCVAAMAQPSRLDVAFDHARRFPGLPPHLPAVHLVDLCDARSSRIMTEERDGALVAVHHELPRVLGRRRRKFSHAYAVWLGRVGRESRI